MTTSNAGIAFIKQHEGLRFTAYACAAGHATIGYGHDTTNDAQHAAVGKTTITLEQAEALLRRDIEKVEACLNDVLDTTKLRQQQYDALVSLVFNIGTHAFAYKDYGGRRGSTLLRMIRDNPNDPRIAAEFLRWTNAGGKYSEGLHLRRTNESKLYFSL